MAKKGEGKGRIGEYRDLKWSDAKAKQFSEIGDPYRLAEGQEAAVCHECHALYQGKNWFFDGKLYQELMGARKVREVICPTCRKIKDHYPEGILTLSGEFFTQHKAEIVRLLEKEANRVSGRNVLDRIIKMTEEEPGKLVVETTTEKLAQHLGRAVYRAYKGNLDFRWSEMNKFVRVYWTR
jgi:NMD protein affecting ribosome stability and mRNA decay